MEISFKLKNENFGQATYITNILVNYGILKTYEIFLNANLDNYTDKKNIELLVKKIGSLQGSSLENLLKNILELSKNASIVYFNMGGEGNVDKLFNDTAKVSCYVSSGNLIFSFLDLEKLGIYVSEFDYIINLITNIVGVINTNDNADDVDEFKNSNLDKKDIENLKKVDFVVTNTTKSIMKYNNKYTSIIVKLINNITKIMYNPNFSYEEKQTKLNNEVLDLYKLEIELKNIDKEFELGWTALQNVVSSLYVLMSKTSSAVDKNEHANLVVSITNEINARRKKVETINSQIGNMLEILKSLKEVFLNALPKDEDILIYNYFEKQLAKILRNISKIEPVEADFILYGIESFKIAINVVVDYLYRSTLNNCIYKVPYISQGIFMVNLDAEKIESQFGEPKEKTDKEFLNLLKEKRVYDIKSKNIVLSINNLLANLDKFVKSDIIINELVSIIKTDMSVMSQLINDLEKISVKDGETINQLIEMCRK